MADIAKRLKEVNDESMIMDVVNDCMIAAEEIERLRKKCDLQNAELKAIKEKVLKLNGS